MLTVYTKKTAADWHVQEKFDKVRQELKHNNPLGFNIVAVQADGHELVHIKSEFINLPFVRNSKVQTWKGDLAQFIYDNL